MLFAVLGRGSRLSNSDKGASESQIMGTSSEANLIVRRRFPSIHGILKRAWHRSAIKLPIPRVVGGHLLWLDPRLLAADITVEPHIIRWIERELRPGETYFDVGAHYGFTSLAGCRRVGKNGRVIAFEPAPPLHEVLSFHAWSNRTRQLEIAREAVADTDASGVPFFLVNGGLSFRNSLTIGRDDIPYLEPSDKTEMRVQTIRLDTFCSIRSLTPDLVKIDVEGAELAVLRGAERLLTTRHPKLIVAVHPPWMPKGQAAADVVNFLDKHGYSIREKQSYDLYGDEFADYLCC
jgi:FkbM family methyltransferase